MITKEDMQNFYFQYIVREDLDGDPLLSLNLLEAAEVQDWQRVETLLAQGAVPGICRNTDGNNVESALVFALAARKYDIARKLYDAGDRLDDHRGFTDAQWDGEIIDFFASEMRMGRNYFFDGSKSFDEHCKSCNFSHIETMLTAFQRELADCSEADRAMLRATLNSGFVELIRSAVKYHGEIDNCILLFEKFFDSGVELHSKEEAEELAFYIRQYLGKEQDAAQQKLLTILARTPISNNA